MKKSKNKQIVEDLQTEELIIDNIKTIEAEETTEETVEEVKIAPVVTFINKDTAFETGTEVKIINFYVKSYNGIKAVVTSSDINGNIEIQFADGNKAVFRKENLSKV